jgi:hypothetical protein
MAWLCRVAPDLAGHVRRWTPGGAGRADGEQGGLGAVRLSIDHQCLTDRPAIPRHHSIGTDQEYPGTLRAATRPRAACQHCTTERRWFRDGIREHACRGCKQRRTVLHRV